MRVGWVRVTVPQLFRHFSNLTCPLLVNGSNNNNPRCVPMSIPWHPSRKSSPKTLLEKEEIALDVSRHQSKERIVTESARGMKDTDSEVIPYMTSRL